MSSYWCVTSVTLSLFILIMLADPQEHQPLWSSKFFKVVISVNASQSVHRYSYLVQLLISQSLQTLFPITFLTNQGRVKESHICITTSTHCLSNSLCSAQSLQFWSQFNCSRVASEPQSKQVVNNGATLPIVCVLIYITFCQQSLKKVPYYQ